MKMKKTILALAALALMAWGCSSSDDDLPKEIPAGKDVRPAWQVPNYDFYEQIMSVEVQVQDTLSKYVTTQDLLCATIGGEVRGVAVPQQVNGVWLFPLMVASDDAGVAVGLSYYCDKPHRIFSIDWTTFDSNIAPTGTGGIYKPEFVKKEVTNK
jgi:hypothetical protein